MIFLSNAFSLSMLASPEAILKIVEVNTETVKSLLNQAQATSAVGHASTAQVLSSLLEKEVPTNRINIKINKNDVLVVFQLLTRLEEGRVLTAEEVASLPYKFYLVEVL